jgi:density-regulated protein DRP1
MYTEIYKEEAKPKPAAEAPKPKEGEEEKKVDDEEKEGEGEEEGEKKQPKKKVKFGKDPNNIGVITVYKQKRGGNKIVSQIVGFEHYTKDLKALASKFGKKFSCGCNLATDEIHGECISVQGDVEDRLLDLMEQDKELIAMNVPFEKIKFVEDGNKKGRKRPGPAKPSE